MQNIFLIDLCILVSQKLWLTDICTTLRGGIIYLGNQTTSENYGSYQCKQNLRAVTTDSAYI